LFDSVIFIVIIVIITE